MSRYDSKFDVDDNGLLVRQSDILETIQAVVPESLQGRRLYPTPFNSGETAQTVQDV